MHLNIIKAILTSPQLLNDEKLKIFPLRSRIRQGCPFFTTSFNILVDVIAREIRGKKMKGIQIRKEVKLSLFADSIILYIDNPRDYTKKLSEVINNSIKLQDTEITMNFLKRK